MIVYRRINEPFEERHNYYRVVLCHEIMSDDCYPFSPYYVNEGNLDIYSRSVPSVYRCNTLRPPDSHKPVILLEAEIQFGRN